MSYNLSILIVYNLWPSQSVIDERVVEMKPKCFRAIIDFLKIKGLRVWERILIFDLFSVFFFFFLHHKDPQQQQQLTPTLD